MPTQPCLALAAPPRSFLPADQGILRFGWPGNVLD